MSILNASSAQGFTLITGATSSIGMELALERCKGENLLLHGRDYQKLMELSDSLSTRFKILIWVYDLSKVDSLYEDFRKFVSSQDIVVERVVHAAGQLKILPFRAVKLVDTQSIYNVNVFSIIEILRVLTSKEYRRSLQSVVFLSAFFSKFGDKGNAIYSSSKGALNSLVKGLAVEFPGTRFNSIILGAVRTKMTDHLFVSGADKSRFDRYILGTGSPRDVTNAINFLLDPSLWMTGQEMFLDGGASIN